MKQELIDYLSTNLNQNTLPEGVKALIHDYAHLHLYWALGWLLITVLFGWGFISMTHGYESADDPDGTLSMVIMTFFGLTIWFFFKFIQNIAVFFAPLGDLF